jgi:hypothetical protein
MQSLLYAERHDGYSNRNRNGRHKYIRDGVLNQQPFFPDNVFNVNTGVDGLGIEYSANNDISNVFGPNGSGGSEGGVNVIDVDGNTNENGTLTYGQETPAPIPGAGLLSYLIFGFGGLFINRKRLWRAARMAAGKFEGGRFPVRRDLAFNPSVLTDVS